MTPSKDKRPLPSTTSMAFPKPPETFQQWKTALDQVKFLHLKGRWKECLAQCNQLLIEAKIQPHPLHATYLHFYSAVSSEAIARLAHDLSPIKLELLEQARTSYQAAALSLPQAEFAYDFHDQSDINTRSTCSSLEDEGSDYLNHYPSESSGSSQHRDPSLKSSPVSNKLDYFPQADTKLRPSSPRIRNIPSCNGELTDSGDDERCTLPHTRSYSPEHQRHAPLVDSDSRPTSIAFSFSGDSWRQARSYERYNKRLAAFAGVIDNHVSTIEVQTRKTQEVQSARYFTRRLASYGEDEETRAANMRFRIARLKASGWKMERFSPERYQDLCAKALAEM
ncbi:hypothetical protein BDR22DRAFT_641403 [Usnea florida]